MGKGSTKLLKRAANCIIDPKWNYKPELRDLLKYHRRVNHSMDADLSKVVPKYS